MRIEMEPGSAETCKYDFETGRNAFSAGVLKSAVCANGQRFDGI